MKSTRYQDAGVDINRGHETIARIKNTVQSTYNSRVLAGLGAFGGLYDVSFLKSYENPVLVASTDGVGTKIKIASALGQYQFIGHDIVNHCVNDILVQGAAPLFFMDYVAANRLEPTILAQVIDGCAKACQVVNCVLLAGETAEMPGVYCPQEFDLVGSIVGVVERSRILDGTKIQKGDVVIGLASSGLHTNGYSLARHVLKDKDLNQMIPGMENSWGECLLTPHRCYASLVLGLYQDRRLASALKALIHITGGGLIDNPPRIIPENTTFLLNTNQWSIPPIFNFIQEMGSVSEFEMYQVFNMGLGMLMVVAETQVSDIMEYLHTHKSVDFWTGVVGHIIDRENNKSVVLSSG